MDKYISRDIESICLNYLNTGLIIAIVGARQVGKTTLLLKLKETLTKKNAALEKKFFYFSLDDPIIRSELNKDFKFLEKEIEKLLGQPLSKVTDTVFVAIDEVQKSTVVFDWLKIIYDQYPKNIKIIISGSSSLEIKRHSSESLGGRIIFLKLHPLTLREIIKDRIEGSLPGPLWNNLLQENILEFLLSRQAALYSHKNTLDKLLERVLIEGSLPAVYTASSLEEKHLRLSSMVNTYLERDVRALGEVGNLDNYANLLKTVSFEIGSIFNILSISSDLGISYNTLKKYISILKETFILNPLTPLFEKMRKQVVKSSKMYFFDIGVANFLAKRTEKEHIKNIEGQLFENVLIKSFESENDNSVFPKNAYFWRDYEGHEIDLVIEINRGKYIPIEIGIGKNLTKNKIINFKHFFNKFKNSQFGLFLYQGDVKEEKNLEKSVYLIPWWLWC